MKLPPMNSLRAFEAVSRLGSVTRAATELCVSQGAVSQQLRKLEDFLGCELFIRTANSFTLSKQGAEFAPVVQNALSQIASAARAITDESSRHTLKISVPPLMASMWLVPKLGDFFERHPDISVVLDESTDLVTFKNDGVDAAIRYFDGNDESLESTLLMKVKLYPYASPAYIEKHGIVESFSKPVGHTLIEYFVTSPVISERIHWEEIVDGSFEELNVTHLVFPDAQQCHYAAIRGQGIIMAPRYICDTLVELRELVRLGDELFEYDNRFYFVLPRQKRINPALFEFRDWLIEVSSPYQ